MDGYCVSTPGERGRMLEFLGLDSIDRLFGDIPGHLRAAQVLGGAKPMSQLEVEQELRRLAGKNDSGMPCFIGAGAYKHYIPAPVHALAGRAEFLTAYTPYQPEISQGLLQAIFEYQTMICQLTAMDASNASLYDGACAAAEAMRLCVDYKRTRRVVALGSMHPQTIQVLKTYAKAAGIEVAVVAPMPDGRADMDAVERALREKSAALFIQQPNFLGVIEDAQALSDAAHRAGVLLCASVNPISLGLLAAPGEYGADVALGDGQPLGNPMSFGGPAFGFIAVTEELKRRLPGRVVGQTKDVQGRRAFVLTMQAREQHIRREKAASNICSNQALCALAASVYMALLGPRGLEQVALACAQNAHELAARLARLPGCGLASSAPFFHEFAVALPLPARDVIARMRARGILAGYDLGRVDPARENQLLVCATELCGSDSIERYVKALGEVL